MTLRTLTLIAVTAGLALGIATEPAAAEDHSARKATPEKPVRAPSAKAARASSVGPTNDDAAMEDLRERLARKLEATRVPNATTPSVRVVAKSDAAAAPGHASSHASPATTSHPPSNVASHATHPPAPTRAARLASAHRTATAHSGGHAHWSYQGEAGPDAWGRMQPEFASCANGQRQSPIDIRGGIRVDLEPVQFDYRASRFTVVDNGHTVQVNVEAGNTIVVMGRRFTLVQFHFHRPSEERIDGRQFDMVAHLVHKDPDGKLAVVAVLLDRGSAHPLVQAVWNNLPLEKSDEVHAGGSIDLTHLLPQDRRYYTYMGSLTTPPCSEGVMWIVMSQPVGISSDQIAVFSHLYPMNARPIQSVSGRLIKSSN